MSAYRQASLTKTFNGFFAFYNFIFVLVLVIVMLRDPNSPIAFMMSVLLFPIFLFFAYNAWNQLVLFRQRDKKDWYFSWKAFFTQDSMLFFLTLALFILGLNLALARKAQSFASLVFSSTNVIRQAATTATLTKETQ